MTKIMEIFIESSEHSFLEIISLVGVIIFLFEYFKIFKKENMIKRIEASKKFQPILGALLGLIPGCAGSLVIVPLFTKGTIGFGAVIATLIATLGDSSFVLMTAVPKDFIIISVISFITAVIMGYLVDASQLGEKLLRDFEEKELTNNSCKLEDGQEARNFPSSYKLIYNILFLNLIIGLILFGLHVFAKGLDLHLAGEIVGSIGIILVFMVFFINKYNKDEFKFDNILQGIIFDSINEVVFIGVWVFTAFFLYDLAVLAIGGGVYEAGEEVIANFLYGKGFLTVIIAGLIGMIPGCGPQIIFVSLYTKGLIPFSALLANSISQDGDALFPLIASHKKSALYATILNLVPALILASIVYIFEILL